MRYPTALFLAGMALAGSALCSSAQAAEAPATGAPTRTIRSLKVLAVIYRGTSENPKRLDQAAVRGTENGIAYGRLFYFRNTGGELNLDISFRVFDADMPDNDGPTYDHIEADLRARGLRDNQYDGVYATGVGATGNWGGFQVLGKTGAAFGQTSPGVDLGWVPALDSSVWYNAAWTFTHEFQHALQIVITRNSGRTDMLSAHPYSDSSTPGFTWGHRGGQHWDWIAHTLRSFPRYLEVAGNTDTTLTVTDTDGDGLADDDPRLPMDEKRFGSDPTKKDTDGDGLDDMAEFTADIYRGADPRQADTDGDGVPDGRDRCPTVALADSMPYSPAVTVDGRLDPSYAPLSGRLYFAKEEDLAPARMYASWNEDGLHLFVKSAVPTGLEMLMDSSADNGYWEGGDTYGIRALPDGSVTFTEGPRGPVPGAKAAWGPDGLEVFIPALLGQGVSNEVNWGGKRRPEDVADGLVLEAGRPLALNLILANPDRRALITPQWSMFDVMLAKSPSDPANPSLRFSPKRTRAAQPTVVVSGVGAGERVQVVDERGTVVGERIGSGPVILTGRLRPGSDAASGRNVLMARAGGKTSAPLSLVVDTSAKAPSVTAGADGGTLLIAGEPDATVDVFAGTAVSPVWGIGTVSLDGDGKGKLARPEGPYAFLGAYGTNQHFDDPAVFRLDPEINFDYQDGAPDPRLPNENFSIRWTGTLEVPQDGDYTFYLSSDDGAHLWVDGAMAVDNGGHHPVEEKAARLHLSKGEHPVRVDYYEQDGWAAAHLEWSGPGMARTHALPVRPLPSGAGAPVYYARQTDAAGNVSPFARVR